jgi:hypothetical protein
MASPPVLNLSGLWIFDGQTEQLDNVLAGLKGDNVAGGRGVFARHIHSLALLPSGDGRSATGLPERFR